MARPLAWLYLAAAGLALAGVGVAIDAYRHDHGAASAELISRSNPGLLTAFGGVALAAFGLLTALTLLAFQDAPSVNAVARRGAGVVVAWTLVASGGMAGITYAATSGLTVGHTGHTTPVSRISQPVPTNTSAAPTEVPGAGARITLRGTLTIDGQPLQADALGAEVIRGGLVSACQQDIPRVSGGRYEITIMADAEAAGCGAPDRRVVLWTFIGGQFVYTREALPWPGRDVTATFDADLSSAAPDGARVPSTGFKGHVVHRDGTRLQGGPVVEAFVGDTRCGVTTIRRDAEAWFTLLVAGPQVTGCAKDGRITFRVGGNGAAETATNDLGRGSGGLTIELTVD